jgi:sec-independent protein translocase protein TatC
VADREQQEEEEELEGEKLSFTAHLEELRARLIKSAVAVVVGFAGCYAVSDRLFAFIARPIEGALPAGSRLTILRVQEGFLTYLKIAMLGGIFAASPVILYQAWKFVAPGLYQKEKRYVWPFVAAATVFFFAGASFAYWVVFPFALPFLLGFAGEAVQATISIAAYLSFATQMLLAFGIVFELPVVVFFLSKIGVISYRTLSRNRGYALILISIVAAVLTPPDAFSMILMGLPLYALFEISILVARIFGQPPSEKKEEEEDEEPEREREEV